MIFMNMIDKGRTKFDRMCHTIMNAENNGIEYFSKETIILCGKCGHRLKTYYCEEQLYVVECEHCEVKCLVEAENPGQACYKTMAYPVEPIKYINEDREAVFWSSVPIDGQPDYEGSVIDASLPDNIVCGMELPFCGTDGSEIK